ncbi:MAG: WecB/TagA/CpsF family glycosyltransferase [Lachnospiraceae bacterium]|nr:WecB/TagA/CpsF family glycosyltransferase [Lachnospiraceae bacterium]
MKDKCNILGVSFTVAGLKEAACYLTEHVKELGGRYICFSNVHTTVTAKEDEAYRAVLNGSVFTFADGKPIVTCLRKKGFPGAERVAGPDFMTEVFVRSEGTGISHFFYGSTEETLKQLSKVLSSRYPGLSVAGMISPPFRPLSDEEDAAMVERINASGADLVWVGLGAPKQEKWMQAHQDKISGVMLGVGAGFDFHAGTVRRAPLWMQKCGLEWFYRLLQDPGRLFKRYLVTNTKFLYYMMKKEK